MRSTILSSIVFVLMLCEGAEGNPGNALLQRYSIEGPEYKYDSWQYTMDFEVSDLMSDSMIGYTLYDGVKCRDGDGSIGDGNNDITQNDGYLLSRFRTDNTPVSDGSGTRLIKIESEIVPSRMAQTSIYRENENKTGIVEYCLRFSNYNIDKDVPGAREVNFLETTVKLSVDLNGDFGVQPLVIPDDAEEKRDEEDVEVEAYICDSDENVVPLTEYNQGQTVRVCVTPTQETLERGFRMRQLDAFTFRREIPFSTRQVATLPGGVPDVLTVIQCRPGSVVCAFETLLFADFFVSEGVISGSGTCFLQFSEDPDYYSPIVGRRLQQGAENPLKYTINIQLIPSEDDVALDETESSAPTEASLSFITTMLIMALGSLMVFL